MIHFLTNVSPFLSRSLSYLFLRSRKDSLESESSAAIVPHELVRTRQLESVHLKFNQESGTLLPLCLRYCISLSIQRIICILSECPQEGLMKNRLSILVVWVWHSTTQNIYADTSFSDVRKGLSASQLETHHPTFTLIAL